MGFSLTAATVIIGLSVLIAAEIIIGAFSPMVEDINESYGDMKNRIVDQVHTGINITNVATTINGANHNISITIENTGSVVLNTSYFNILVNGTDRQFVCSKSYIYIENIAYFNVTNLEGNAGPRRLKVVTGNGVTDYYDYTL
jgi:archaellum component FlaF (FlaF/FlaG flagellin family)